MGDVTPDYGLGKIRVTDEGHTPRRTVRIPDEVWIPAMQTAGVRGESVSNVVRAALEAYAANPDHFLGCIDRDTPKAHDPVS